MIFKITPYFFTLFVAILSFSSFGQKEELIQKMNGLADLTFTEIENVDGFEATFELMIKQPLDHSDHSKGHFYQQVYLAHRGFDKPTVIVTEGYTSDGIYPYEVVSLLDANQVEVEHRYFGESLPDSMDYTYLNVKQAAADLHHVRELLGQLYQKEWVSTGISKGGATTVFYKYFYPEDVAVGVPYVAPINRAFEEPRIYEFLDTVGSDECRQKIEEFQIRLLKKRKFILDFLRSYVEQTGNHFTYKTLEEAFELAVLEYSFSFWQYGVSCHSIPGKSSSFDEKLKHFLNVSDVTFFSDEQIAAYGSHYYQAAQEMGYYGYEVAPFAKYLKALSTTENPHAAFTPIPVAFDGALLEDVNLWLLSHGDDLIYIYGGIDTWSASAVLPSENVNSAWFFLPGKHHGNARYENLTPQEKARFNAELMERVNVEIK